MKFDFVVPSWSYWTEPLRAQPLTQMYLATILENEGHEIVFTDFRDGQKTLPNANAHFYTVATPDYEEVKKIISNNSGIHIAGGPHINLFPEEVKYKFDSIAMGEGEESIKQIAIDLKNNNLKKIYSIKTHGEYPFPKRHFLPKDKIVTNLFKTENIPSTTVQFAFGCPYSCSFCANYNKKQIVRKTYSTISNEIDYLKNNYGVEGLSLQDEICIPQNSIKAFEWLTLLEYKKIKWRGQIRAITDEDIIKYTKKSGCIELSFGLESADQQVLNMTNKHMNINKVEETIRLCKKYDIKTRLYLINGLPYENEKIVDITKKFINKNNPDIVLLSSLQPYPGSPIATNPEKYEIKWINTDYTKYNHLKCRFEDNEDLNSIVPYEYKNGLSRQQIYNNLLDLQHFLRERGVNK